MLVRGSAWALALRLLVAAAVCGPAFAHELPPGASDVRFRTYTTAQGLSQATAYAITQDQAGFLWVGTQDGLNRFDGYAFRVYRHERSNAQSLADNNIPALAAGGDGSLWVGTQAGGLDRYDPATDRFTHYRADPGNPTALAANHVTALLRDSSGRLWVATNGGHLQWFDPELPGFRETPLTEHAPLHLIRALAERGDGVFLVGTHEGLWQCEADARNAHELRFDAARPLDVQALAIAPDKSIWVSTVGDGLFHFGADGALREHYHRGADPQHALPDDQTRGLAFDHTGRLWVATKASGVVRIDPGGTRVAVYLRDPAQSDTLAANRQESVFVDRGGLVWAGSWLNGLSVHDPRTEAFALIDAVPNDARTLPARAVGDVFGDSDGTLWFAVLEGGGLVHFDLTRGVLERYANVPGDPESLPRGVVQKVLRTRDGSLWAATADAGLARLARGSRTFQLFRHDPKDAGSLASDDLLFLYQDRAGTLWVGTVDAGLDELCETCRTFRHHAHDPSRPESLGGDAVATVLETRNGELWVGLRPGGLDKYDRTADRFEHVRARANDPGSLGNDTVTFLFEDHAGALWVGTQGGGLSHLLPGTEAVPRFEVITRAEGLGADAIGSVVEDSLQRLWLSTTRGITRYDPRSRRVLNIDGQAGAQDLGYFIHSAAVVPDGRIVFGGLAGVTVFDPSEVTRAPSPQPAITDLVLPAVRANDAADVTNDAPPLAPWSGREIVLDHGRNTVHFEFGLTDFAAPADVSFSYQLEGYDPAWIVTQANRRYAAYTNLPSGSYRLRVRARNGDNGWNEKAAELPLRVQPAPWASPLAFAGYAIALLAIALVSGWRVRAGLRRDAEAQAAVRASEERLKFALWGSGGELWDVDVMTGRMHRENRLEHLRATQEAKEQTLDRYRPYVHPDDLPGFERQLAAHLRGQTAFLEASYRTQGTDGEWHWLLTRGRVAERDANGRALRITGTTQDISTLKRAEESLRLLNEELEFHVQTRTADLMRANDELRHTLEQLTLAQRHLLEAEKMAALGGLVAGVAHEINTPLGITVTAASHLQEETARIGRLSEAGTLTPQEFADFRSTARESAEIILRNLYRADRLIKSFKLIAVDQTTEERRSVELGAYLNEILTSLGPALKKTPHSVAIDCPAPIAMNTYPGALYQIVSNLVMNSLTHAFEPGRAGHITLGASQHGANVYLRYADDGCGMSAAVSAQIYEPFFTTRRGQGGSGLGMHVVYNLVTQLLRGSIRIDSAPGQGTRFEIVLPLELPATAAAVVD